MAWNWGKKDSERASSESRNDGASSTENDKCNPKINRSFALRFIIPGIILVALLLIGIIIFKYVPTFKSISLADNIIIKVFIWLNIVAFILLWVDKIFAYIQCTRFPNITLYLIAAVGGGIGTRLARLTFRHKITNHEDATIDKNYKIIYNLIEPLSLVCYILLFIVFY